MLIQESGANNHQAHEIQSLKLQNSELVQKLDEKKKELVRANAIIESLQVSKQIKPIINAAGLHHACRQQPDQCHGLPLSPVVIAPPY